MKMTATILSVCVLLQITQVAKTTRRTKIDPQKKLWLSSRNKEPDSETPWGRGKYLGPLEEGRGTVVKLKDEIIRWFFPMNDSGNDLHKPLGSDSDVMLTDGKLPSAAVFANRALTLNRPFPRIARASVPEKANGIPNGIENESMEIVEPGMWAADLGINSNSEAQQPLGWLIGDEMWNPGVLALDNANNIYHMAVSLEPDILNMIFCGLVSEFYEYVSALEWPRWGYEMYSNHCASIVDLTTDKLLSIIYTGKEIVSAGGARVIFNTHDVVAKTIGGAMHLIGKECMTLKPFSLKVKMPMVDQIDLNEMELCGLSHFKPLDTVKVGTSTNNVLFARVRYAGEHVTAYVANATIRGFGTRLLDNQPLSVTIDRVVLMARVEFKVRTQIEIGKIRLRLEKLEGFQIRVHEAEERNEIMDLIENLSSVVSSQLTDKVNSKLEKFDDILTG